MKIHEYLELDPATEDISCSKCGERLCSAHENYREHTAMKRIPVSEMGPEFAPPADLLEEDPNLEMRRFFCRNCGVLFGHQVAREDEPILHDIDIDVESL
jgi:acetone carboxylase gamma subunit